MYFFKILLAPFAFIYWIITGFRNLLFNAGVLKSEQHPNLIICVGNLCVGGSGKTPHLEYLIRLLGKQYKIATLSRGYGRTTSGFLLAEQNPNARLIGDEPYQLHEKFNHITVAVDEKRNRGISKLIQSEMPPDLILLDDAFQHRYVKADLNILLTEYDEPFHKDFLMPMGKLRESRSGAQRADIIVVTKCPPNLTPLEMRSFSMDLNLAAYQKVYFSYIDYQDLSPINEKAKELNLTLKDLKQVDVCLMTAIAKPKRIIKLIKKKNQQAEVLSFPDHYFYRPKDYQNLQNKFSNLTKTKILIVTDKDAGKLKLDQLGNIPLYSLPIKIKFHSNSSEDSFDQDILNYVKSYKRK